MVMKDAVKKTIAGVAVISATVATVVTTQINKDEVEPTPSKQDSIEAIAPTPPPKGGKK